MTNYLFAIILLCEKSLKKSNFIAKIAGNRSGGANGGSGGGGGRQSVFNRY